MLHDLNPKVKSFLQVLFALVGLGVAIACFFFASQAHGQTVSAVREDAIRTCVATQYTQAIGVREATGRNDGNEVKAYLHSIKLPEGHAWCAAFCNYILKQCGVTPANSGWSPNWFPKNRVVYHAERGLGNSGTLPQKGDVFGIYFPAKGRIAHVGFIDTWGNTKVTTVEGNTNTAGSREGDGVYKKTRLTKQIYAVANWISL